MTDDVHTEDEPIVITSEWITPEQIADMERLLALPVRLLEFEYDEEDSSA
jgi:hypothetical protein